MKPWKINYDVYCKGVEKIYSAVQPFLPYVLVCDKISDENYNTVSVEILPEIEGFEIDVSEPDGENQSINIRAKDKINLLYAAADFKNIVLPYVTTKSGDRVVDFYEYTPFIKPLRPYHTVSSPRIKNRGLWTWGHTIYDYKRYIDNLVTLKMNTLIIWNDFVPVNIEDVISYAHENGVAVYLGYAWGWDTNCAKFDISDTSYLTEKAVNQFKNEYASLSCDGIYFQSFTELSQSEIGGVSIADAVITFVNRTAEKIFDIRPKLKLLFGIHGISVKNKAEAFKNVDRRITLFWEDLGAFPFHNSSDNLEGFDDTVRLVEKLQEFPQDFGAVLKSFYRLDWSRFKHQSGPFIMGTADRKTTAEKLSEQKELHKRLQADWIKNAPYAQKMIKEFRENSMITVLAEDGLLEEGITYPLALYSELLWNYDRPIENIMQKAALMPDVTFF